MADNLTVKAALQEAQALHEHTCTVLAQQRDAAQARVRELEARVADLLSGVDAANERWLEAKQRADELENGRDALKYENDRLRTVVNPYFADALNSGASLEWAIMQAAGDAAIGRDLRCLMECGLDWRYDPRDECPWSVCFPWCFSNDGTAWPEYDTLPDAARAVREWQTEQGKTKATQSVYDPATLGKMRHAADELWAGMPPPKPAPTNDPFRGQWEGNGNGVHYLKPIEAGPAYNVPVETLKPAPDKPEPAPTPEDAAVARVVATGGRVYRYTGDGPEAHATFAADGARKWCDTLDEAAAFAEAHRAVQEPPGAAPKPPAEG